MVKYTLRDACLNTAPPPPPPYLFPLGRLKLTCNANTALTSIDAAACVVEVTTVFPGRLLILIPNLEYTPMLCIRYCFRYICYWTQKSIYIKYTKKRQIN